MRPIRNNNQPKKRSSAFFDYFLRQPNGEDFLTTENMVTITRKATMFFRDMANGSFDIDKHGQYLSNDYLLNVMLKAATIKVKYYSAHCQSMTFMLENNPGFNSDDIQFIVRADFDSLNAYSIIYDGLINLLQTKNLGYLGVTANRMRSVKYSL